MSDFAAAEAPSADTQAVARREQLETMGEARELEPGVLTVHHLSGYRTKWLRTIGGAWIKVSSEVMPWSPTLTVTE